MKHYMPYYYMLYVSMLYVSMLCAMQVQQAAYNPANENHPY